MYTNDRKQLYFPHVIPGSVIAGRKYEYNDLCDGSKKVEDLRSPDGNPYTIFTFMSGRVSVLGRIKALGLYACISNSPKKEILGYYVDRGSDLTEAGREAITKRFPDIEIYWDGVPPPKAVAPDDIERRKTAIAEYVKYGHAPEEIGSINLAQLEEQVRAIKSGKNSEAHVERVPEVIAPAVSKRAVVKRRVDELE